MFVRNFLIAGLAPALALSPASAAEGPPSRANSEETSNWLSTCESWDEWDKAGPPFRIYGNSYYVGTCGISAILITSDKGHVLIDGGTRAAPDLIEANITALGFRLADVGLLLSSHEHNDHIGGLAELKRRSGAAVLTSAAAATAFASGTATSDDPQAGMNADFDPVEVDIVLEDSQPVSYGPLHFTPVFTPGHTPGALSWQWQSCEAGQCRALVYADSLSAISNDTYRFSDHPDYLAAFKEGIGRLRRLDCDILLTPHPSSSQMVQRLRDGSLIDSKACRNYAKQVNKALDKRLAKEAEQSQ
ncbi:subclass B3 metallo-beta-lactamase [Altericroceibacterium endophyticum]|nr:subclass B3 metallo-beta-lactamase [Altericroceibacterium endophyticum]